MSKHVGSPVFRRLIGAGLIGLASLGGCANTERSRDWSDPKVSGQVLAQQVCSNCHGIDGQSVNTMFPKLAGQQREYIDAQLEALRARDRNSEHSRQFMWGPSRYLSDDQIDQIAEYFSSQRPMRAARVEQSSNARGEKIFREGVPEAGVKSCASCHGEQAQGDGATPRLAGQHGYYLVHRARIAMTEIMEHLSDEDIAAVAVYLAEMDTGSTTPVAAMPVATPPVAPDAKPAVAAPASAVLSAADGDGNECKYSVWTYGWYCGSWWKALLASLKNQ